MKLTAIIPAFNEEKALGEVILRLKNYVNQIIVIDDGSKDKTWQVATESGAAVYHHLINRGVGGALRTGFKAALLNEADIIITLDADGQHDPAEIPQLIKPILGGEADAVIGSRFLVNQKMPIFRKLGVPFFNIFIFLLFGIKTTDSQSGMRAFNKRAAASLKIYAREVLESPPEILRQIQINRLRLKEVPIKAIYTEYSLSKGQRFVPGLKTLFKLFFSII